MSLRSVSESANFKNLMLFRICFVSLLIFSLAGAVYFFTHQPPNYLITSFADCVAHGFPVTGSAPRLCAARGAIFAESHSSATAEIYLTSPISHEAIASPVILRGAFLASTPRVAYRIRDSANTILAEGPIVAGALDGRGFASFETTIGFADPRLPEGFVEVLTYTSDNVLLRAASVPVNFSAVERRALSVFFSNRVQDPQSLDCARVYPVSREITISKDVQQVALAALLSGPTSEEAARGYFTHLNDKITLLSLKIRGSVAYADFDERLEYHVGGSCRVGAIRAQITETLLQFPEVKEVVISVRGRSRDILQP